MSIINYCEQINELKDHNLLLSSFIINFLHFFAFNWAPIKFNLSQKL